MPRTVIHTSVTERLEILDEHGQIDPDLDPGLPPERLLAFFRDMLHARLFDDKALKVNPWVVVGLCIGVSVLLLLLGALFPT